MASVSCSLIDRILVDDCFLEIFRFATSGWDTKTLFSISQVSSYWRNLALANASLWTEVFVDESSINYSEHVRVRRAPHIPLHYQLFPRVHIMLERSINCPISVKIDIPVTKNGQSVFHPRAGHLANLLYPHRGRVVFFHTKSAHWAHHVALAQIFTGDSFPFLRSISIECCYKSIRQESYVTFPPDIRRVELGLTRFTNAEDSAIPTFPNLRDLSFLGTLCDWGKYPGRNLSTITLAKIPFGERPSIAQLCSILSMSKNTLTVLQIHGSLPYEDKLGGVIDVVLPHLETLSLFYAIPDELVVFFNRVRVPALKKLDIRNLNIEVPLGPVALAVYAETLTAFESMTRRLPLEQIEDLRLGGLLLGSPPRLPEGVVATIDLLPAPFQFVQRLQMTQVVQLDDPGRYLLSAACYPAVGRPHSVVLPNVQRFVLTAGDDDGAMNVRAFLNVRWGLQIKPWSEMEISVPASMIQRFRASPMCMDMSRWTRVVFKHLVDPAKDQVFEYGSKDMDH